MRLVLLVVLLAACEDVQESVAPADCGPGECARLVDALRDAAPEDAAPFIDAQLARQCDDDTQWCLGANLQVCERGRVVARRCPIRTACVEGECRSIAECVSGERRCNGDAVDVCQNQIWVREAECQADEICQEAQCEARDCLIIRESASYVGCQFIATQLPNIEGGEASGTGLIVANRSQVETVTITLGPSARLIPQQTVADFAGRNLPVSVQSEIRDAEGALVEAQLERARGLDIPPGGTATLLLPYGRSRHATHSGIHNDSVWFLRSNKPVVAYQFTPYCCNHSYSNDASLLYPTGALGSEYRYIGLPSWEDHSAMIAVAATEDITVQVEPTGETRPNQVLEEIDGRLHATLEAGDLLIVAAAEGADLTGTRVITSEPAAVFSSHPCTFYPHGRRACDHVEEQLAPTDTLGTRFQLVPTLARGGAFDRGDVTYFKLAGAPGTSLTLSLPYEALEALPPGVRGVPDCGDLLADPNTIVLDERGFCELGTDQAFELEADDPLSVLGILAGEEAVRGSGRGGEAAGDPSIFLIPPVHQYRRDYTFLTPGTYLKDYVTVITHPDALIELDGAPVDLSEAGVIEGRDTVFVHIQIEDGAHQLAGDRPFAIIVYAYDSYVSYAFAGGLDLGKR